MSGRLFYFLISLLVLVADQWSKYWAATTLKDAAGYPVIPNLLSFEYTENRGIALGWFGEGGATTKWLLVGISLGAAIFVIGYMMQVLRRERLLLFSLALLLAGIVGNLIDRFWHGYVIDFILFYYDTWNFPIFNIADTAISLGAGLMAIDILRSSAHPAPKSAAAVSEPSIKADENV